MLQPAATTCATSWIVPSNAPERAAPLAIICDEHRSQAV
jgi:hypothetical protein